LPDTGTPIFGPYSGKLSNRSDRVALETPQYPELPGDPYSWVSVDEVIFGNQTPWLTAANGAGATLQRTSVNGRSAALRGYLSSGLLTPSPGVCATWV